MAAKQKAKTKATPRKKAARKETTKSTPAESGPVASQNKRDLDAAPTPAAPSINDIREDSAAVLGHFVEVTKGDHKGRYGVFEEVEGDTAIVRTRDNDSLRFSCPVADLIPAEAGRR